MSNEGARWLTLSPLGKEPDTAPTNEDRGQP